MVRCFQPSFHSQSSCPPPPVGDPFANLCSHLKHPTKSAPWGPSVVGPGSSGLRSEKKLDPLREGGKPLSWKLEASQVSRPAQPPLPPIPTKKIRSHSVLISLSTAFVGRVNIKSSTKKMLSFMLSHDKTVTKTGVKCSFLFPIGAFFWMLCGRKTDLNPHFPPNTG